ncbi:MAG: mechanosensitive ion channel family protein [Oscillatoriophycideae cyanobacterium NC_groundwater_1537_Pr4_S-0.65um_50_18]|nr:mechanosensitive ion channel family protein [Oscillatoriophycideae cyanobacterium NC_groundwater_1537_Pr4_S-0.65um_50_18]
MPPRFKPFLTLVLVFGLALGITLSIGQPSQAQFALPEGFGSNSGPVGPPKDVVRYGNIETLAVDSPLSALTLFTIASPTVYDRTPETIGDRQTVERRVEEIRAKLLLLLNRPMDAATLIFGVSQLNNVTVINAKDAQYPRPLTLLSVTELDADFNGQPVAQLAEQWRQMLEQELREGLQRLPDARRQVNHILAGLFLLTAGLVALKYGLSKRQKQLRRQKKVIQAVAPERNPEHDPEQNNLPQAEITASGEHFTQMRAAFLQRLQQVFSLDRQLSILSFIQWLLFWLMILAWYGGFTWIVSVSPYLIQNQFNFLGVPLALLTIWFFTGLAIRISRRLIDHFVRNWETLERVEFIDLGDTQRRQLRSSTIAGAAKGLVTLVIALFGLLSALGALGLPTVSVVAIGSLAGLAITFGSQNLVKDLVNGFFILAEDQYAIGDVIDLGQASGLVENLNMRVTQLRSGGGELVTIPNSSITQVKNLTRNWSRVNFSIDVDYQADPDRALAVLQEVAQRLYHDPLWRDKIMAEPTVLGIDGVSHSGMTMTTLIQTKPGQQWAVGREFRLRVRRTFAENDIAIGAP